MLKKKQFICGEDLTLADISMISGFSLLESTDYDINQWTNICQWIGRVKEELKDCYEDINGKAIENTRQYIKLLKTKTNQ